MIIDKVRTGFPIFSASVDFFSAKYIPASKGSSSTSTILSNNCIKLTSSNFISPEREGMSEVQKKKLSGVITNASKDEIAVSVTDSAKFPFATIEK